MVRGPTSHPVPYPMQALAARKESLHPAVPQPTSPRRDLTYPSHPYQYPAFPTPYPHQPCLHSPSPLLLLPFCWAQFMERLQNRHGFGFMAVSLGYFDSLMSLSAASTSSELAEGELAQAGIGGGYVRLSVGITGEWTVY